VARAERKLALKLTRAEIIIRRGNVEAGASIFHECTTAYPADSPAGALARFELARLAGFDASVRAAAIRGLQELLASTSTLAAMGPSELGVPQRQQIERLHADLTGPEPPDHPRFLFDPIADAEDGVRFDIRLCEYTGLAGPLPALFAELCQRKRHTDAPTRLLELAQALMLAAKRVGDELRQVEAENFAAMGHALLGDRDGAIRECESALASNVTEPDVKAALQDNHVLLRNATDVDAAIAAGRQLRSWPTRGAEPAPSEQQAWQLSRLFLRQRQVATAIAVLRQGAAFALPQRRAGAGKDPLSAVLDALQRAQGGEAQTAATRRSPE